MLAGRIDALGPSTPVICDEYWPLNVRNNRMKQTTVTQHPPGVQRIQFDD
jgi:hypothetical protein